MANKTNKILAAIGKLRAMSKIKVANHKCTTVRIQDPHISKILNLARRKAVSTKAATSPSSTPSPAASTVSSTGGSGGY